MRLFFLLLITLSLIHAQPRHDQSMGPTSTSSTSTSTSTSTKPTTSASTSSNALSQEQSWEMNSGPDDALCASYTASCSSCLIQGCTYCDTTGNNLNGQCYSQKTAYTTCNKTSTTISSFASLQQCSTKQHDIYVSIAAFLPIIWSILGIITFAIITWFVRPSYATPIVITEAQQVTVVSMAEGQQQGQGQGQQQALLPPQQQSGRWVLLRQRLSSPRIQHFTRSSGCFFKVLVFIVFLTVWILSIAAIAVGMWSIQFDGTEHGDPRKTASSGVLYDARGVRVLSRDPNSNTNINEDDQNDENIISRRVNYQCRTVDGDGFIRCMMNRLIANSSHSLAITALVCLSIVLLQFLWSFICRRSLSNLSVKLMTWASLFHVLALLIYVSGPFLLQSRVYQDLNVLKATTSENATPYRLHLGPGWNIALAAAIINLALLIPITRIHIHAIQAPSKNKSSCCCRSRRNRSASVGSVSQQGAAYYSAPVMTVAVPSNNMIVTENNPFHTQHQQQHDDNTTATGTDASAPVTAIIPPQTPRYIYGTVGTTPALSVQQQQPLSSRNQYYPMI